MKNAKVQEQIDAMYAKSKARREAVEAPGVDWIERVQANAEARGIDECAAALSRALDAEQARR